MIVKPVEAPGAEQDADDDAGEGRTWRQLDGGFDRRPILHSWRLTGKPSEEPPLSDEEFWKQHGFDSWEKPPPEGMKRGKNGKVGGGKRLRTTARGEREGRHADNHEEGGKDLTRATRTRCQRC